MFKEQGTDSTVTYNAVKSPNLLNNRHIELLLGR